MLYTDNIGLKKPAYNDPGDIADLNENSDIIDREFGNRYLKSETYSVEQVNNAIAQAIEALPNGLVYRGAVNYYKDLPTANNELGDTYSVKYQGETGTTADGNEYAWGEYDGTLQWIKLGVNAYSKDEIDAQREAIESDILTVKNDIVINRVTLGTQCKNILPIKNTGITTEGITFTINADGSINAKGTAPETKDVFFNLSSNITVPLSGQYILTGCPSGGGSNAYQLYIAGDVTIYDNGDGATVYISQSQTFGAYIKIAKGQTVDLNFFPMLRSENVTDNAYEPYIPSLQAQINALVAEIAELKSQTTTISE